MSLDPRVKRFLDLLAASNPSAMQDTGIAERRAGLVALMKFAGPAPAVAHVKDTALPGPAGPLPVRVYTPQEVAPGPRAEGALPAGLVYFHGGGMVAGSVATHDPVARALANAGGCRVVSVEYRLAPEHRFPAALDDAQAAVRHIATYAGDFGIEASRLGVCGDSAGGTLAAAACQALRSAGRHADLALPQPLRLLLLLCPILDYSGSTASRRAFASGYLVDQATLDHDLTHYLPAGADPADPAANPVDAADPRVSPLRARDLGGLPPTLIHTAEYDPLRDEGALYCEGIRAAGGHASVTCHPGMIHLFYGLGGVIPYARAAFDRMGAEIRAALA
jgi:acetyl esterase/lipase